MQCVEACPKGVDPMGRIMSLRDKAMQAGFTNTNGARHTTFFTNSVGHKGWIDEFQLPIRSKGVTNVKEMLKLIPVGIRAAKAGKVPNPIHKAIPGVDNVRRIHDKVEKNR